ncbi:hypothetical protein [Oscillibacter sp.]|uniref:hypothetical protein n=1 Tax=Oscillibacter sp. TaxID=1945593 RepID=UPI002D7E9195|nr:hypothetical protein [Oscillibacter sp.]
MKKTDYCHLNQWELSDRIRMEDFNADNAKIAAELARLRRNVADLAFQVGQLSIAAIGHHDKAVSRRFVIYDGFTVPNSCTLSGGASISNGRVTLMAPATSGTVTVPLEPKLQEPWEEIYLWYHSLGGSVTPTMNGTPMTHLYTNSFDITGKGGFSALHAYRWTGPYTATQKLVFELTQPAGTGGIDFSDFCVAFL